jgi:hypothetical protein
MNALCLPSVLLEDIGLKIEHDHSPLWYSIHEADMEWALQQITKTKRISNTTSVSVPQYIHGYATAYIVENTHFFNKIKKNELAALAASITLSITNEFLKVSNDDLRISVMELVKIR